MYGTPYTEQLLAFPLQFRDLALGRIPIVGFDHISKNLEGELTRVMRSKSNLEVHNLVVNLHGVRMRGYYDVLEQSS